MLSASGGWESALEVPLDLLALETRGWRWAAARPRWPVLRDQRSLLASH